LFAICTGKRFHEIAPRKKCEFSSTVYAIFLRIFFYQSSENFLNFHISFGASEIFLNIKSWFYMCNAAKYFLDFEKNQNTTLNRFIDNKNSKTIKIFEENIKNW
jgi:hypothetical protein